MHQGTYPIHKIAGRLPHLPPGSGRKADIVWGPLNVNQRHFSPTRQLANQVLISGRVNSAACNLTKSYMLIGFWPVSLNRSSVIRS